MPRQNLLFEVSYEVCNKVGGIYALIRSKASYIGEEYGGNYFLVGPYMSDKAVTEFEEHAPPEWLSQIVDELLKSGIKCHYGRWLMDGRPNTLLIDYSGYLREADRIKKEMWDFAKVDSLFSDNWFTDPVIWSTTAGILIEKIAEKRCKNGGCIVHLHEWLSGGALLHLKRTKVNAATVFTTHATVLGRAIAGADEPLYEIIEKGHDGEKNLDLARKYNVLPKHTMEVACAKHADVFTTVSEVTGKEAAYFLDRKPDVLLLNGIDLEKYPEIEELTVKRRENRVQMRDFLISYFGRYYDMDFRNIRSMFISGRYEFHNKGVDLFIDALGELNERMKKKNAKKTAVAFIWIPAATKGENFEVLKNKSLYEEMKDHISEMMPELEEEIMASLTKGELPKHLIGHELEDKLRKLSQHFAENKGGIPPLCAFELSDPENDEIIRALSDNDLLNREEDKVKVIYYPSYLSTADRLISLDYNDATLTCDVGVFPSYYEPWGYTPLETAAQGSLAITTDIAGFGKFIDKKGKGIYVLPRSGRKWDDMVSDLAGKLFEIVLMQKSELAERRMNARKLAALADWRDFVKNYFKAYEMALEKQKDS